VLVHVAAAAMGALIAKDVIGGYGVSVAAVMLGSWNLLPVLIWWPWALSHVRHGRVARAAVVGAPLTITVGLFYWSAMADAASSDANGALAYLFLPFWLAVGVCVGFALTAALAWMIREADPRPPAR
jgi:hypothetical protein